MRFTSISCPRTCRANEALGSTVFGLRRYHSSNKKAPAKCRGFSANSKAIIDGVHYLEAVESTKDNATICEALVTEQRVFIDTILVNIVLGEVNAVN